MVGKKAERTLQTRLLRSKMAVLIPESDIPVTAEGRLLIAGLFCVPRKRDKDRLIFDRRPQNHGDIQFKWARMPVGCQLVRLVLEPHEGIRGSGDDLRTYFYNLANTPGALRYNAFGRRVWGQDFKEHGGKPGAPIASPFGWWRWATPTQWT